MICSNCQTVNIEDAKFCMNCGESLNITCPRCKFNNPGNAKFCVNCSQSFAFRQKKTVSQTKNVIPKEYEEKLTIARTKQSMKGERRIVTILFCDVKGSTSMAEKLDPEEWAEIMNQAFDFLIAPIYKYEGTLARLMGDSVLAFFGAPLTHEDDPKRALLAGLDMLEGIQPFKEKIIEKHKLDFDVRVGINTGLVVVGGVGSDLYMEYTALGDAINIAARMEQTAEPGTIQIWEDTHKLVKNDFDFQEVLGIDVKGKTEQGKIYQVQGIKSKFQEVKTTIKMNMPLVGREKEVNLLQQKIESLRKGQGQIINIIGEAGLGKSRLIREAKSFSELTKKDLKPFGELGNRWDQIFGVSYETTRPYSLIKKLIKNFMGLSTTSDISKIRKNIIDNFTFNTVPPTKEVVDLFELLLGVDKGKNKNPLAGEGLKKSIYNELYNILEALVIQGPTVIAIDDLHWSDPASVDLLIHLFSLSEKLPILFICGFRPDSLSPAWKIKQIADSKFAHRYTEIKLETMSEKESDLLYSQLVKGSKISAKIKSLILKKSDGNPLFMEEVIRSIQENQSKSIGKAGIKPSEIDIDSIAIPDNLQSLLAAQIDRIGEGAKQVLQLASVIGRSFHHDVLTKISQGRNNVDSEIINLQQLGLILESEREPYLEYIFRQALTQETAYNTILLKDRRDFHKKIGEAFIELFPDQKDEFSSIIGHHFYQAKDSRALKYLIKEGDTANRFYANIEAISFYSKAIEASKWDSSIDLDTMEYLYSSRGRALELSSNFPEALENYKEFESLAIQNNSKEKELWALVAQALIYSVPSGEFNIESGLALVEKAKSLAKELNDQVTLAKIYWIMTMTCPQ
ncbi:MAG: AAA family ATPase [Chloroflexi bacterium]|nr:AAA family ATPase [Chloroflexota bacterium]